MCKEDTLGLIAYDLILIYGCHLVGFCFCHGGPTLWVIEVCHGNQVNIRHANIAEKFIMTEIRTYLSIKSQNLSRKTSRRFFCRLARVKIHQGRIMDWLDWIFFINRSLVIRPPAYLPSKDSKSWIFQIGNLSTRNQKRKIERILCEV